VQAFRTFALQLALILLALLATKPDKAGDFFEYAVTTIAIARHGTPDVRVEDAALAAALSPEAGYRTLFLTMREQVARGEQMPMPGLYRGKDGIFTIHFLPIPRSLPCHSGYCWRLAPRIRSRLSSW
jgi:hypothetical protein